MFGLSISPSFVTIRGYLSGFLFDYLEGGNRDTHARATGL